MIEELNNGLNKSKRKREKAEDFIGEIFNGGKLKVVGIHKKSKNGKPTTYKVTCTECSKDKELFPDGYFISMKGHLINGCIPCGCSKKPEWDCWQYLVLARRTGKDRFIVHGFNDKFKNQKTKLDLECLKEGYRWTATISDIVNNNHGCPKCAGQAKPTEQEALQKCIDICNEMDYDAIGFPDGYKNQNSRFEYNCKTHGKQNVSYNNFVNNSTRCNDCAKHGYSTSKQGTFYVYQWTKDDHSFIKFGITNQKEITRVKKQKTKTEYKYKKIWSATFDDGFIPLHIENYIKNSKLVRGVVDKEDFTDGFTETTCIENLDTLECLIIEVISQL